MYDCFRPGKIWLDNNGKRIQAHGGSILFAENKFWWYGENKEGITGTATGEPCKFWHHGVKLYSSTDLYNWVDEGFAFCESDDVNNPFYPTHIMDRPHIIYNDKTKQFVMWSKTSFGDFGSCTFTVCAGDSLKNLKLIHSISPTPHNAGDFDLFKDGDKAYVVFENPHTEIVCRELTDDYLNVADNYSCHLEEECPPFVREAPAYFVHKGVKYLFTSGTTGYYPNATRVARIDEIHGKWTDLGNACVNDFNNNSFHAQFSSVFKHPFKKDLYIAVGDRWLTDLPIDLPDINKVFYGMFSEKGEKIMDHKELKSLSDENTSEANYVFLPVKFKEDGTPYLEWCRSWKTEDFE